MARLLIVEDNPSTARNMSLYLSGAGHQVLEASSADQAAAADVFQPDIVILSTAIPRDDLVGLMAKCKTWECNPKVVLTALRGNECACQELLKAGASDYVIKSTYFQNNLIDKISQALTAMNPDLQVRGSASPERPLFKFRDRRGQGPQIPVHAAFDRRKGGRAGM